MNTCSGWECSPFCGTVYRGNQSIEGCESGRDRGSGLSHGSGCFLWNSGSRRIDYG